MATVDVWRGRGIIGFIKPSTTVYTMRLTSTEDDNPKPLLCDLAWTTAIERGDHFWFKDMPKEEGYSVEPISMPFKDYLALHLKEISGMNPFWSLGRAKFVAEWNDNIRFAEEMEKLS